MNEHQIVLSETIKNIKPLYFDEMTEAMSRMDILAKPPGSLGKLEDIAVKLAGITGKIKNNIEKKSIIIMCSDNGVVEEGVSSSPQSVTLAQTINFAKGMTGVAVLAKHYNSELIVVDVGVNANFSHEGVIDKKIALGTKNICKVPAMTRDQARQAIATGIWAAQYAHDRGIELLGVGEMGIGNTTTSSAMLMALTGCETNLAVGRGAGLTDEAFHNKKRVIEMALMINAPDANDPIDVLSKVGGFDIGAMAGVYLGAARFRIPVVVDGFISVVAALLACKLCPTASQFMFGSHLSHEIGYNIAARAIGIDPMLQMNMRLGEGSGCPLVFSLIEGACAVMNNMATFEQAKIDDSYLQNITRNCF